ncbi:hypothetical protein BDA99DRAFT_539582 [Phascolomyces articulosus]|uniref:Kelch repeat protein n=1 Tax=Phascolomyces articulosus TaxID=60185 RepID=A0AAD5K529_9FUNG|nr:hypothetical protein BDA99DRAFT_539582 [Phascolomyces articulosus]
MCQCFFSGCIFMPTVAKIYCYGGVVVMDEEQLFISLDLSQSRTIDEIQDGWETVNKNVGENSNFAMVAVPNQNLIYANGGRVGFRAPPLYQSVMFNNIGSNNEEWVEVSPRGSGVLVKGLYILLLMTTLITVILVTTGTNNICTLLLRSVTLESDLSSRMYILDLKNKESPWKIGASAEGGTLLYHDHASVLVGASIYYIGGSSINSTGTDVQHIPMDSVRIFDTNSGEWTIRPIGGSLIPSRRKPSTGEILVFGGIVYDIFENTDVAYILNTQGGLLSWSSIRIQPATPNYFDSQTIYGHSAVLAGPYLYILFGYLSNDITLVERGRQTDKIWVMDINQWAWISSVDAIKPELEPINTPDQASESIKDARISGHIITGATIGGTIGFAALLTGA